MWFVMQSRHIQNQPKKNILSGGPVGLNGGAIFEGHETKASRPRRCLFHFQLPRNLSHSFSKRDLKVLDFPHCYQNLLDEMSWFWTFDSQRHGLALVVSSRVPLTDPLSRLCVPGSIITTASWHRITTKLQENHDRTIRGMIEWYRMISNDPWSIQDNPLFWKFHPETIRVSEYPDRLTKFSLTWLTWLTWSKCLWHFAPLPRCCHISRSILATKLTSQHHSLAPRLQIVLQNSCG